MKWDGPPLQGFSSRLRRSRVSARWVTSFSRTRSRSLRPTSSSTVRMPRAAIYSRSSWATNSMKFTTYSGLPEKRDRSWGFWVAMPAGQVSRLHTRIMQQPRATRGAVAKPNSSAPSIQAMATSRPVISLPSASRATWLRRPLAIRAWWASATPSSQGRPAPWMELRGAAPVPPSWPEISTTWAPALATPAAMVPTPASLTSFTLIRARRLAFFRS